MATIQVATLQKLVNGNKFSLVITWIIIMQAAVLALETFPELAALEEIFATIHWFVVGAFVVEAGLKIASQYPKPQAYFKDGWNVFDFAIIILSLIPFTGSFSTVARLVRLLRITRLTNRSKEMRIMITTIIKSLPSMLNIVLLLGILFFIYGVAGYHLFSEIDYENWGTLPRSLVTLFKVITLEGWVDLMKPVTDTNMFNVAFFVSFIVIGTFVVINLFVAIIVKKTEEAYRHIQDQSLPSEQEILGEIREIRRMIEDLERRFSKT
ncbi:MAG: ion transporter [Nitrososphaera sp.]|jgi:voltage-gated sodium channel